MSSAQEAARTRSPRKVLRQARTFTITGGAGFIGSHLCSWLLERGDTVFCIDDFSTGGFNQISRLKSWPNFNYLAWDIRKPFDAVAPHSDFVFNLACPASPPQYQADRLRTAQICAFGTLNALAVAARDGATFLQASTSEIYGDPEVHPQSEEYRGNVNTTGPRSCYDEGKRFAETLVSDFCDKHRVNGRIARIFNTYGPGMQLDDGRVVSNFVSQALLEQDITVYGDGDQTRSFCYVADTVKGLLALAAAPAVSGPINIGNPDEITVGELADVVLRMTGSRARRVNLPLPVDDPRRRRPDISRAMAELKWRPRTPLATGLRRTIADFAARLKVGRDVAVPRRSSFIAPARAASGLEGLQ